MSPALTTRTGSESLRPAVLADMRGEAAAPLCAIRAIRGSHDEGRDSHCGCVDKSRRVSIGADADDLRRVRRIGSSFEQRLQVAPAARDQHREFQHSNSLAAPGRQRRRALFDADDLVGVQRRQRDRK